MFLETSENSVEVIKKSPLLIVTEHVGKDNAPLSPHKQESNLKKSGIIETSKVSDESTYSQNSGEYDEDNKNRRSLPGSISK